MVEKSTTNRSYRPGGLPAVILRHVARVLQIVTSVATIVIWGGDIQASRNTNRTIHSDWYFSVVVSALSLITALVWLLPILVSFRFFFVDAALAVFWLIVFAIWGRNYIPRDCNGNHDCQQLKYAVWFSLAAWLLWIATAVAGFIFFNRDRRHTHAGSWMNTIRGGRGVSGYPHSNV